MDSIIVSFRNSLNEILTLRNIDSVKLGKELGIDPSVVRRWRNKGIDVRLKTLIRLADYFECSIEYLCGKSHNNSKFVSSKDYPNFGERLLAIMKKSNIRPYQLFDNSKIVPSECYYWLGGGEPSLSSLQQLSEYFNVTLDYLVGRQDSKERTISVWLDDNIVKMLESVNDEKLTQFYIVEEYNAQLSERRETRRHQSLDLSTDNGFDIADDYCLEDEVINDLGKKRLREAIQNLLPSQRKLIRMVFWEWKEQKELAREQGVDPTAIRNRLSCFWTWKRS